MIPQNLIPVIAAYLGCKCEYEYWTFGDWEIQELDDFELFVFNNIYNESSNYRNLKLLLRPISSITDEEIILIFGEDYFQLPRCREYTIKEGRKYVNEFNKLRSIGIFVDPEIEEWVKLV